MDMATNTKELHPEIKTIQENILLNIVKEVCSAQNTKLSQKLLGKVNRIIADCDLTHYSSFHKLTTSDESTAAVLGLMQQTSTELTFEEQTELNQAVLNKIQEKLPMFIAELDCLKENISTDKKTRNDIIKELQDGLDEKLNTLYDQENEKVELMMEWLNHRVQDVTSFSCQTNELLTTKTKILELKSKILHLRVLSGIFTETNQTIAAYREICSDLQEHMRHTEQRIKNYKDIIGGINCSN